MERLGNYNRRSGISVSALRTWGAMFLAAGIIGRGLIQNHLLGFGNMDMQQMYGVMESSEMAMTLVTLSIVLQVLEACAVPIYTVLLVEGIRHTQNTTGYFLRLLGAALAAEIPYNLAMGSGLLDLSSRNPMFSLVLGMALIYFYRRFGGPGLGKLLIRILLTAAALVWTQMLNIDFGESVIVMLAVLWALREKPMHRNFAGAAASVVCCLFSPFFLAAPMAFLAIHMCNWEKAEENRIVNYLMYPGMLLLAAAAGLLL